MSLSSFLLGKRHSKGNKDIDGDLDSILRSSISTPPTNPSTASSNTRAKRGTDASKDAIHSPVKRKKLVDAREQSSPRPPRTANLGPHSKARNERKGNGVYKKKAKTKESSAESDDEDADAGLEEAYERKAGLQKQVSTGPSRIKEQPSSSSDSEGEISQLVHETAVKERRSRIRPKRVHNAPLDETKEQRDARTIFLGNVPTEVAKERSALKDFKRHIRSQVPGAKIESMRFRSVAFQRPMSATPAPRTHDLERTAEWRATKGDEISTPRPRLSSGDKKRIAFIQHELHADAASVTVYVVFAHGADLAPDEAAKSAVAALDNTQYMGRTLRADTTGGGVGDPKRTIFVGSLDFAAREEDLREFFEGVVSAERGPRSVVPGDDSESDDEEDEGEPNAAFEAKPKKTWVTRVRIVRDKDTQLGKGFAYVQFADRQCVDEVLALEPGKLKFAKRKLRVERCKSLPSTPNVPRKSRKSTVSPSRSSHPSTKLTPPMTMPKGNPDLGAQLSHLSKTERKAAKAADPERVARRLAKKKARNVLQVPEQKKDRLRVRKKTAEQKGAGAAVRQKKTRVRSEQSVAKRNTKK